MTREEIRDTLAERLKVEGSPELLSLTIADIYATLAVSALPETTASLRDIISQLGSFFSGVGPGKVIGLLKGKGKRNDAPS